MATLNLGKLKFNWRGNWVTETAYAVDDVVFDNGTTWIVTTAVAATNTTRPESSASFAVMASGLNFRGDFSDTADYFENDVVTHDSAVFLATSDNDPASGNEPNTSPLNSSWDEIVPAPENNVLTTIGDLLYRDNTGANARLAVGAQGAGLTVQQDPRESIPSRAIRYDEPSNNHGRARDQNDQADASTTFGSTDNNGVIFCTRGLTYTITVEVDSSTRNYNLHTDASGEATNLLGTDHAGSANANVTNGSGTLNFQPDSTTPDDVYIRDHNSSGRNVRIRVVDMALCPSWGAAPAEDSLVLDDQSGNFTHTLTTNTLSQNLSLILPNNNPSTGQVLTAGTGTPVQSFWGNIPPSSTGNDGLFATNKGGTTMSGSTVTITGIPSNAVKIDVLFDLVSVDSSTVWGMRLGTSAGIVTSNYNVQTFYFGGSAAGANYTNNFQVIHSWNSASYFYTGKVTFNKYHNNMWFGTGIAWETGTVTYAFNSIGWVDLGGTLDRLQFTPNSGSMDNGFYTINVYSE
ncbi:MAG: hypothetical protein CMP96_05580 [Gammaproteobacteria bacterium]|nr:hypothetical protein [Gammaproteobacteria bacterium]|tara:strand:- start:819 stop:2372 length:1554 start_codon:yes stop_codon:yes gene_type:complete